MISFVRDYKLWLQEILTQKQSLIIRRTAIIAILILTTIM